MTHLWSNLSPRERLLILVATALAALLLVSLMIIRPVLGMRNDAQAAFDEASQTYTLVLRAASGASNSAEMDPAGLRSLITRSASSSGVIINRINSEDALIDLSVSDIEPERLYNWLSVLESQQNVIVMNATIRPTSNGQQVTARLGMMVGG